MPDLQTILSAARPLTLSGVPHGFLPSLLADLARAGKAARCVYVAPDDAAMRAVAATAPFFAPEIEVVQFPAWDCLPYDRASPTLRIMAERVAALHRLQAKQKGPQLFLTTANAVTQARPDAVSHPPAGRDARAGRADRPRRFGDIAPGQWLCPHRHRPRPGRICGARLGWSTCFPSGEEQALRLDFFGDEIESVRQFDPADQRTIGRLDGFTLLPASEALLDEDSVKRFRGRYRETFGATATGDPLYQAVSDGRRLAGMEHWLPLFEEKLATFWDHLGPHDLVVRDSGTPGAVDGRLEAVGRLLREPQARRGSAARQLPPAAWQGDCISMAMS